jgi:hypothetical protein
LSIAVDTSASDELFGKDAADLMTDVTYSSTTNKFTGTLKYVTGYTNFSETEAEQSGNYLAFDLTRPTGSAYSGATFSVSLPGGGIAKNVTSTDKYVCRVTSADTVVNVTISLTGHQTYTKAYDISALTLSPAG